MTKKSFHTLPIIEQSAILQQVSNKQGLAPFAVIKDSNHRKILFAYSTIKIDKYFLLISSKNNYLPINIDLVIV